MTPREMAVQAVCMPCQGQGALTLVARIDGAPIMIVYRDCEHCGGIGLIFPREAALRALQAAAPDGGA